MSDRDDAAGPASDEGPPVRVAGDASSGGARRTRPPSSGIPGTRLSTPTSRLVPASAPDHELEQALGQRLGQRAEEDPAESEAR